MQGHRKLTMICCAAVLTLGLAACGGGSDTADTPPPPPPPTPYEMAAANIAAATTAAEAQAAYDAVKDDVTASEGDRLQAAVDARAMVLATMARAGMQQAALMTAAGMIDTSDLSTQDLVDAARTAIAGLRQAIADAVDVDDTSMYQTMLDNAVDAVDTAQGGIDTATRRTNQMAALSDASDDLQSALAALSGVTPTQALLNAANTARTALNDAITAGADLTDAEKATYVREAANAAAPISTAQMAFDDDADAAERDRIAAMAVTASKLYAGIGAPNATASDTAQRQAMYSTTDNADITVTWGPDNTTAELEVDEDATVEARGDWTGQMFTASPDDAGTYEAVVYSHLGDPTVTDGQAFNVAYPLTAATDANPGETAALVTGIAGSTTEAETDVQERVASPSFDQSAGVKEFELGTNMVRVMLSGSYHGVSGTYYCTPAASSTCAAEKADDGFALGGTADADNTFTTGGGTWTFKPTNPEMKLMDTSAPDTEYASYGWWLHKSEDGDDFVASAFATYRGTAPTVAIAGLRGDATYTGGAAGKYSLRGDTGGTNDAGHFTADVTLNATFADDHTISGTVDGFIGADGESRDWSVALSESRIGDDGAIGGDPDTAGNTDAQSAVWTIGEDAGAATGTQWSGNLHEEGADGVPAIATGTFYSQFGHGGNDGKIVGAFGANN